MGVRRAGCREKVEGWGWEWRCKGRDGDSENGLKDETCETDLPKVGDD